MMPSALKHKLMQRRKQLRDPRMLPKLEAWYDSLDPITLLASDGNIVTDGGTVCLWKDKSGNSGTVCYVSGVAASNSVSSPNKSVTGNQTFTLDVGLDDYTPSGDLTLVSKLSGNDGFAILVLTTGVVRLRVGDGASVTNVDSSTAFTMTDLRRHTIGIAWTDGVGASFTQDGAPVGTPVVAAKTLTNAAVVCTIGTITGRIYRVQVGSVYDFNPAGQTAYKLANGDTLTTGGDVWTLAQSGATGGRIAGERDEFQCTAANRPVYLKYEGTKYAYLSPSVPSAAYTPNSAAVQLSTALEIDADLALESWTLAAVQTVAALGQDFGNNYGYYLYLVSGGFPRLVVSTNGTALVTATCDAAPSFAARERGFIRVNWTAASGEAKFYTSTDGATWTPLGATQALVAAGIHPSTNQLNVGSIRNTGDGSNLQGRVYSISIKNALGGTPVAKFEPTSYTSGTTFTASTGEVWTINGGAHIVTRTGLYFDGSNDYLKSAAFSLSQPDSVYLVGNQVTWTDGDRPYDGNATNAGTLLQRTSTPNLGLYAGGHGPQLNTFPVKTPGVITALLHGANSTLRYNRGAAATGNALTTASNGMTLCSQADGSTGFANMFISELSIYSAAHPTATQDRVIAYLGRRHGIAV